ncbi:MAG: DUF4340 domain-containing protein [Bacteriovorax sp.]|nr:DUF4340 domain-containing protein [Bacteriovorax sp.]
MQKRQIASNLILFLFFIVVSLAAIFSDLFQNPIKTGSEIIEQAKLFTSSDLGLVKNITLKNKSGEFAFERNENNQISPWHMVSPREISANSLFIEKLFNALTTIKVKKIFPEEQINISNFSIDKPTSTLNITDQNGKEMTIVFGLMNTIDNSTYIKISGRNGIYHVEAPNVSLENASILNLIESQIISINLDTIVSFKIYRGNKKNISPQLEIKKQEDTWFDRAGNTLPKDKIDDYFHELSNLKSSFIIDKQTDSQKKQLSNLTRNSDYIVSIEDNKANTIDYNISGIIHELSDLDLKNEDCFVVTISNNTTSYVVKKEFHELFNRKSDSLGAIAGKPLQKKTEKKTEAKPVNLDINTEKD